MTTWAWLAAGATVWLATGFVIGAVLGGMVRHRDTQVPRPEPTQPNPTRTAQPEQEPAT